VTVADLAIIAGLVFALARCQRGRNASTCCSRFGIKRRQ
jgi:hypothetical protein